MQFQNLECMNKSQDIHHIYFLGIGGIGMSALARYYLQLGATVSGYDRTETTLTRQLVKEGISIIYDEIAPLPEAIDLAVFTPAVPASHPAFTALAERGIPLLKRAELLGLISQSKRCIAIAGTHGKTTTSAILAHMLRVGGVDCTAFLGGISANYGTNYLLGHSDWVVVEADEYDRSFLQLHPTILILNALDPDHLDIYGDARTMEETYYQLIGQIRSGGSLLYKAGLTIPDAVLQREMLDVYTFGEGAIDFPLTHIRQEQGITLFDLHHQGMWYRSIRFTLPGMHNASNAAAAFSVGLLLGMPEMQIREGLESFRGVDRRFSIHYDAYGITYVDDYAHHPVELNGLIQAARSRFPGRRITGIFQPHLFTRTRDFAPEFAAALDLFDDPIVTDIYPAREIPLEGINAHYLLDLMHHPQKKYIAREELLSYIEAHDFDVLITAGAGDVDALIPQIIELLQKKNP